MRLHLEKIVSFKLSFGKIYCAALPSTEIMESFRKNSLLAFFLDALASHVSTLLSELLGRSFKMAHF